jgi:hypothetical protein
MIREAFTTEPLPTVRFTEQKPDPRFKPEGLWYSCGDEWERWNRQERPEHWKRFRFRYQLNLDLSKILRIRTVKEFDAFNREYSRWNERLEAHGIEWARVAMEYDGIEICPYRPTRRESTPWYQGWDVASGCVWSASAVTSIRELPFASVTANPEPRTVHWKEVVHHLDTTDPNSLGGRSTVSQGADEFDWTLERHRIAVLPRARPFADTVPRYAEMMRGGSAPPAIVIAEHEEGGGYDATPDRPHHMGGAFEVWDGNHRLAAAQRAGLEEVDVYVGRRKMSPNPKIVGFGPAGAFEAAAGLAMNGTLTDPEGIGSTGLNKTADYRAVRVMMRPSVFLSLAAPLKHRNSVDWFKAQMAEGRKIASPFLIVRIPDEWFDGDMSGPATVWQHEGRNRMTAILELFGDVPVEVLLWDPDLRRADFTDEWIERMRAEMLNERQDDVVEGPLFELVSAGADNREDLMPNRAAPFTKVKEVFDQCFDIIDEQFPDFGEVELHEDEKAGSDNGAGSERQFGYCKNGTPIVIAFAAKTENLPIRNIRGLMRHEFGHALDFRYGRAHLSKLFGERLSAGGELRADQIAEHVFGDKIEYDDLLIQCIGCGGVSPRPKKLGA